MRARRLDLARLLPQKFPPNKPLFFLYLLLRQLSFYKRVRHCIARHCMLIISIQRCAQAPSCLTMRLPRQSPSACAADSCIESSTRWPSFARCKRQSCLSDQRILSRLPQVLATLVKPTLCAEHIQVSTCCCESLDENSKQV